MYNPFKGVTPSLGPFAAYLQNPITIIIGLVWALAFVVAAVYLTTSVLAIIKARRSRSPHAVEEAAKDIMAPAIAVVGLALVPVIFVVLVNMAG